MNDRLGNENARSIARDARAITRDWSRVLVHHAQLRAIGLAFSYITRNYARLVSRSHVVSPN